MHNSAQLTPAKVPQEKIYSTVLGGHNIRVIGYAWVGRVALCVSSACGLIVTDSVFAPYNRRSVKLRLSTQRVRSEAGDTEYFLITSRIKELLRPIVNTPLYTAASSRSNIISIFSCNVWAVKGLTT